MVKYLTLFGFCSLILISCATSQQKTLDKSQKRHQEINREIQELEQKIQKLEFQKKKSANGTLDTWSPESSPEYLRSQLESLKVERAELQSIIKQQYYEMLKNSNLGDKKYHPKSEMGDVNGSPDAF